MPRSYIADSSALVAFLDGREQNHAWARSAFGALPTPWLTCEAVVTDCFYLMKEREGQALKELLYARTLRVTFDLDAHLAPVLNLMKKYADARMSLADACLVRMSETLPDPLVITIDADFRIYRRHSRLVVPCLMP